MKINIIKQVRLMFMCLAPVTIVAIQSKQMKYLKIKGQLINFS